MSKDRIVRTYLDSRMVMKGNYPYFVNPVSDGNPGITKELLDEITDNILEISDLDCDLILAPEAMGIQYAAALTIRTGIPFQVIRKRGHGFPDEISFIKSTGYGESQMFISGLKEGTRAVIVDDVLSTGGTLRSMIKALKEHGVAVTEVIVVLDKSDSARSISEETGVPVKSVLKVGVKDGRPVLR